jgi:hypothetical protein
MAAPVAFIRSGDDEPVHAERDRPEVDPKADRPDDREEPDAPEDVAPWLIPREPDAGEPLAVATDQVDHEERGREPEHEPERLVDEQRVLVRARRHSPLHRLREQGDDRVRGARQERDCEHRQHLPVQGASIRRCGWCGREVHLGKRSSHRIRVRPARG